MPSRPSSRQRIWMTQLKFQASPSVSIPMRIACPPMATAGFTAVDFVLVLFYSGLLFVVQEVFMNARVKTVTAAPAQQAVDVPDDWIVVGVVKRPIWRDGKVEGFIRRIIMDRANKDLPRQPEAASQQNEINEGTVS